MSKIFRSGFLVLGPLRWSREIWRPRIAPIVDLGGRTRLGLGRRFGSLKCGDYGRGDQAELLTGLTTKLVAVLRMLLGKHDHRRLVESET